MSCDNCEHLKQEMNNMRECCQAALDQNNKIIADLEDMVATLDRQLKKRDDDHIWENKNATAG